MVTNNFLIPLTLFFATFLLIMFPATTTGNALSSMEPPQPTKAPTRPKDMEKCVKYLPELEKRNNRYCTHGDSEMRICYPAVTSEEGEPVQKIKPSRRFSILAANKPEKLEPCPTEEGAHKYRDEYGSGNMSTAFLDDYHQLFLSLIAHEGPKCGMEVATTTAAETTNATTTALETTNSTEATTTTAPTAVKHRLVPNSYELLKELQDGCKIKISAELPKDKGTFVISLLKDYPEPIGLAETMFKMELTDKQIILETPRNKKNNHLDRKDWFDQKKFELEIRVHDNEKEKKYEVYVGGTFLRDLRNDDHPSWASNYIHIIGDLVVKDIPTLTCDSTPPRDAPSIDWSNKLDNTKPEDLEIKNLEFKSSGSVVAYLLKGCPKFDMTVCTFAMEYKFTFLGDKAYAFRIKVYSRQLEKGAEMPTDKTIEDVPMTNVSIVQGAKYNMTISLALDRGIGLWVHGQKWKKAKMESMDALIPYIYHFAEFVQVLTEGEVKVDHWQLETGPKPTEPFNDGKFEEGKTGPTWIMEQKLANWDNGDYVKLRIKMIDNDPTPIQLVFYRGYPKWLTEPISGYHTGQKVLQIMINPNDGTVVFKTEECNWIKLGEIICTEKELTSERISADQKLSLKNDEEYMINIMAQKNNINHKYEYKLDVFDTKNTSLATYVLVEGPPYYTFEYFSLLDADSTLLNNLVLMDKPKFCKVDNKKC